MKQETIEQAARSNALDDISLVGLNERAIAMKHFAQGARWRISEAWHDAQDGCPPAGDDPYLAVLDIPGFGRKMEIWSGLSNHPFLVKWAYIDDLLPDGEEAER